MVPETKKIKYTLKEIPIIAAYIKSLLSKCSIIAFSGSLGAGKTTLIKEVLRQCGIENLVTSPTFTYFNQYKDKKGNSFYHFDLYRIDSVKGFIDQGFDEMLYEPGYCFIEWPEKIMPLLKNGVCFISLNYGPEDQSRIAAIEVK